MSSLNEMRSSWDQWVKAEVFGDVPNDEYKELEKVTANWRGKDSAAADELPMPTDKAIKEKTKKADMI